MLKETKRARVESFQPYVIVDIDTHKSFLRLSIHNIGNDNAFNINLKSEPILKTPLNNINFLPPSKQLYHNLFIFASNNIENKQYQFIITYENSLKRKFKHIYPIDISPILESMISYGDGNALPTELSKLTSGITNLEKSIKKTNENIKIQTKSIDNLSKKLKKIICYKYF